MTAPSPARHTRRVGLALELPSWLAELPPEIEPGRFSHHVTTSSNFNASGGCIEAVVRAAAKGFRAAAKVDVLVLIYHSLFKELIKVEIISLVTQ